MPEMKLTDLVVCIYQQNKLYEVTEGCYYIGGVDVRGVCALIFVHLFVEFLGRESYNVVVYNNIYFQGGEGK